MATALGQLPAVNAVATLIDWLGDESPYVRGAVATALGNLRARPPGHRYGALAGDPPPEVKRHAARALAAIEHRVDQPLARRGPTRRQRG